MNILSLGAGVQSSALLLMALRGETEPLDGVIFADTGWETQSVYRQADFLEGQCAAADVPFWRVSQGNIRDAALKGTLSADTPGLTPHGRFASMPLHLATPKGRGMLRRHCTSDFKITPIRRKLREIGATAKKPVTIWIGISLDEAHRMRDSAVKYIVNAYPLIERRMTRHDCLRWLEDKGYDRPPKSACIGCPFKDNTRWREMKLTEPDEWRDAVKFDSEIRSLSRIDGAVFLHRSLVPLSEVDLSTAADKGQTEMFGDSFGNECEGLCGT